MNESKKLVEHYQNSCIATMERLKLSILNSNTEQMDYLERELTDLLGNLNYAISDLEEYA